MAGSVHREVFVLGAPDRCLVGGFFNAELLCPAGGISLRGSPEGGVPFVALVLSRIKFRPWIQRTRTTRQAVLSWWVRRPELRGGPSRPWLAGSETGRITAGAPSPQELILLNQLPTVIKAVVFSRCFHLTPSHPDKSGQARPCWPSET